jgi:hypothetical protein
MVALVKEDKPRLYYSMGCNRGSRTAQADQVRCVGEPKVISA